MMHGMSFTDLGLGATDANAYIHEPAIIGLRSTNKEMSKSYVHLLAKVAKKERDVASVVSVLASHRVHT